ncbi:hypothetical protein EZ449_14200 [Pedobacter frigidisoli]|uniref:MobA/VirD2-like nuclease domain-containing protein n=1 Tax=Pedobacter frigidisoli TaxID=2530455 RepID=A0A4R0P5H5_9SPHI|nr:relaxase/mobilization nuclease domain-containing protein [Pedobacter frigidisoli]TCD07683.1 hypothetical protein EZ449_14200 [Pedobacter frigidisoli]
MSRIVLRLFTTARGFPAIAYNMNKVLSGKAQLLHVANLGVLYAFSGPSAADLTHYFGAVSSLNLRSRYDQFHAVLSTRGKRVPPEELLGYAQEWLKGMGYQDQPLLIFFHEDTQNHHLHIVSTDVRIDRSKIADSFDRIRGIRLLNQICGVDEQREFSAEIAPLLSYRVTSIHQLSLVLRERGYHFYQVRGQYVIRKYGITFFRLEAEKLLNGLKGASLDHARIEELHAMLQSGTLIHNPSPIAVYQKVAGNNRKRLIGYRSALSEFLERTRNISICYSLRNGALIGFTLIDHPHKQLIDGAAVMPLNELIRSHHPSPELSSGPYRR